MALTGVNLITDILGTPGSYLSANVTVTSEGRITAVASAYNTAFPSGTVWAFTQASAPSGWTQVTTSNNVGIRIVGGGGGGGGGGSIPFTTLFTSPTTVGGTINITSGQVSDTVLTIGQMAQHTHEWAVVDPSGARPGGNPDCEGMNWPQNIQFPSSYAGNYEAHTHGLAGIPANATFPASFDLKYVDQLFAVKN